jgi:UDP-N-acetylmuramoyl-tripeptide--D-alanyl-D-alanine ligase
MDISQLYQIFLQHPNVTTDSREVPAQSLFFALKGERFNGNEFAADALQKGAAYAVIDEQQFDKGDRYILVDDVLATLQELATHHRQQWNFPFLAITGSNGKTTTKELVGTVLKGRFETHVTQGNINNHIGVPLTLLGLQKKVDIAVIEMGANHIGEIARLCQITQPTHGLITNIGKAHLEGFGSLEGVKKAKGELYDYLRENGGKAFVNQDDPAVVEVAKGLSNIDYSCHSKATYTGKLVSADPYVTVQMQYPEITIETQLAGDYNAENVVAAVSVGHHFGVEPEVIKQQIEKYQPTLHRSQVVKKHGNTIWLDAYNANPVSMRQALDNFFRTPGSRKIVVLGDMLELGEYSRQEHKKIAQYLKKQDLEAIVLVGEEFKKVKDELDCHHFDNVGQVRKWFEEQSLQDCQILIKGSRGLQLEKLVEDQSST